MLENLGITLIKLPLPFRLNHVNCYCAEGENGYVILDTGLNRLETRNIWNEFLQNKEVEKIIVSHTHPDHTGFAGTLQKETGAKVYMSEIDYNFGKSLLAQNYIDILQERYKKAGVPQDKNKELIENMKIFKKHISPFANVDHFFVEGEKIQFGPYEYEVIFTPGHSDGLVVFYNKEKNLLLSTDHILPKITPNISYWFVGDENPLKTYMNSLKKIEKLNVDYVIPSHGKPFYDCNKRISEIFIHHDERLEKTLQFIKEQATAYDVCIKLFGTDLTIHEYRFAIGETLAHLEYLRSIGECKKYIENEVIYYTI